MKKGNPITNDSARNHDPQGFALADALAVLVAEKAIATVLLPGPSGLVAHEPRLAGSLLSGSFTGARLDSRQLLAGEMFVALPGDHVHGRQFAQSWLATGGWVLTDSHAGDEPLLAAAAAAGGGVFVCPDAQLALGLLARAWRDRLDVRVVAVTGTNGKTTTKDFLVALLSGGGLTHGTAGNFNNFLGLPLTLLGLRAEHRFAVIEMGASAGGEIDYLAGLAGPEVGIITNASPAHLAEFGSLAGIITGKGELLDHLPVSGTAILNTESPGWDQWRQRAQCRVVSLGKNSGDHRWAWQVGSGGATLQLDQIEWPVPLPGEHNAANLAAAILAARELGLTDTEIRQGLLSFVGSPHRGVQLKIGGRTILDDAYNANPISMLAAVQSLLAMAAVGAVGRSIAVLGHMAELGPDGVEIHRKTGGDLAATGLMDLVVVGEAARPMGEGFDAAGGTTHYCAAVEEAARWLVDHSQPGDSLLLKGSRSAAMEKILPLLIEACGNDGTQD